MNIHEEPDYYVIECPHCQGGIQVFKREIACQIFRHGVFKINGIQMSPHTPKEICNQLIQNGSIWGCGKPLRFDGKKVEVCGYI